MARDMTSAPVSCHDIPPDRPAFGRLRWPPAPCVIAWPGQRQPVAAAAASRSGPGVKGPCEHPTPPTPSRYPSAGQLVQADFLVGIAPRALALIKPRAREPLDQNDVFDTVKVGIAGDDRATQMLSQSSDETVSITDSGGSLQTGGR